MFVCAAATRAHEADGVRVIDHDEGVVLFREVADGGEVGDEAVHREDAVAGDEAGAGAGGGAQLFLEIGHVVVAVAMALGLAEAHAVDDRGVIQLVGNDRILGAEQRLEKAAIRIEAGAVEDGVFGAEELAELRLEQLVRLLRAADETHAGHPEAPAVERFVSGADDLGMIGESKIIVRAEIQDLAPAGDADVGGLRGGDDALFFEKACGADLGELCFEAVLSFSEHGERDQRVSKRGSDSFQ